MTIERAFRLVHHLDIPEAKRRYWPKFAEVVVSRDDSVPDIFQFFAHSSEEQQIQALQTYPGCMIFPVTAGVTHATLTEFTEKVTSTAAFMRQHMKPRI